LQLTEKPVDDKDCTAFLQWALPQIELRWPGFRKVRRQVCKRIQRRMRDLGLHDIAAYRARLESDPAEWRVLDESCHITISRFFRDRCVFESLRRNVLPQLAARGNREGRAVRVWSAGCAAGEEPYTLKILWDLEVVNFCPDVSLSITATDIDEAMLARARHGCFARTSLRELPLPFMVQAFDRQDSLFCVKPRHRAGIEFLHQDLRSQVPASHFDLILCRYLAFTYFAVPLQQKVLARIMERLLPGGYFVIGTHEKLPGDVAELVLPIGVPQIFQKQTVPAQHKDCA
jgi:chemotaxis protein methyltransferase CheR